MELLSLDNVDYSYALTNVLTKVSLRVVSGDILTVCGPSGCGKSTLLLVLAGLAPPIDGFVSRDGPPSSIVYVPQRDTLLPWLSLPANINLGHAILHSEAASPLDQLIDSLNVRPFLQKPVTALSGGMRKRACLARAFCAEPGVVLLDEPFNNLDFIERERLEGFLVDWVGREKRALVCVTHDIEQAAALGNKVGCFRHISGASMDPGSRFELIDVPRELLGLSPAERRVHSAFSHFEVRIEGFLRHG